MTTPIPTQCVLCGLDRPLQNSHIIPEFLYDSLYDDMHRFHVLTTKDEERDRLEQKGYREKLLCAECEQRLGVFENYASRVMKGGAKLSGWKRDEDLITLEGVDYSLFKLFQLSILWRAGVSRGKFFHTVQLGPHEPLIRQMLLSKDPGPPDRYPCLMWGLTLEPGKTPGVIIPPCKFRLLGQLGYEFVFGGVVWRYIVTGHAAPRIVADCSVQPSGRLVLQVKSVAEHGPIAEFMRKRLQRSRDIE